MESKIKNLNEKLAKAYLGGGQARIDKQHEKKKLTARERVNYLLAVSYTHLTLPTIQL